MTALNFSDLRNSVAAIGARLRELKAARATLVAERARVKSLPRSRADLIELATRLVDDKVSYFQETLARVLRNAAGDGESGELTNMPSSDAGLLGNGPHASGALVIGLLGDIVRPALSRHIAALDLDDADGIDSAERARGLATLEGQIAKVDAEISDLAAAAAAVGLKIDG